MSNKNRFKLIDSDIDSKTWEYSFSAKLTKGSYKRLARYCRKNTTGINCGHSHDCCGCLCEVRTTFTYHANQVVITHKRLYNY